MENSDLMIQSALKALTPEQQLEYKKMGEFMYKDLNKFTNSNIGNSSSSSSSSKTDVTDDMLKESVAYIETGIRSGLMITDLEENEIEVLKTVHGEKWYLKYGFNITELDEKINK